MEMKALLAAAADMNKVMDLNPPLVVVFESKAKGAARKNQEAKFVNDLTAEMVEVLTGKDANDQTKYLTQPGDMEALAADTIEVIKQIAPEDEITRLFGTPSGGGRARSTGPKNKGTSASGDKKKAPGVIASILDIIKKKGPITPGDVHAELVKAFPDRDSDSMKKTVQAQIGGKKKPCRMEREKGVKFKVGADGQLSIKK